MPWDFPGPSLGPITAVAAFSRLFNCADWQDIFSWKTTKNVKLCPYRGQIICWSCLCHETFHDQVWVQEVQLLSRGFPIVLIGGRSASTSLSVHFTPNFPTRELKKQEKPFKVFQKYVFGILLKTATRLWLKILKGSVLTWQNKYW